MTSGEGSLPNGWAWSKLARVATWGSGGTPNKAGAGYYDGEIPWAVIGDLNDGIVNSCRGSITGAGLAASSCKLIEPGVLLIAMYGSIGKLGITGVSMATNQAIAFARPHLSYAYLFHYLMSQRSNFSEAGKGATQQNISQTILKAWPVPVAPLAEQERIVVAIEEHLSHLGAAEAAIASARRRLQAFERAAVSSLFERDDWGWTTLGEIAELKGGVTKDAKRQADPSFVEVPYLRVANVQRGFLDLSEVTSIRVTPAKAKQLALQPGDILFNEGGDRDKLGRGAVWDGEIEGCIHQNHVFRARVTSPDFDPHFVSMHGNTWGQQWFEKHGKQTTNLASINLSTLKAFPVPAPAVDEQRTVMAELGSLLAGETRLTARVDRAAAHAAALRRSILAAAFSGRLVAQDPSDEPAEVLLARLAEERSSAGTKSRATTKSSTKVKEISS